MIKEECGILGIYNKDDLKTSNIMYDGLLALQHRGQESCGIAVNDDNIITCYKDIGLVSDVFTEQMLSHLSGNIAIGHVRYSTTGSNTRENAQPLTTRYVKGSLTVAHNGNISNAAVLRNGLENEGFIFQTTNDTEIIAYLIAKERIKTDSVEKAVLKAVKKLKGSYSLLIMSPRKLIAVRDPYGIRPLCMGRINNSPVFASESCAIDQIGAKFERDIKAGEIYVVSKENEFSINNSCDSKGAICVFEHIYFARPDSIIDGQSVYLSRLRAGEILAEQSKTEADIVIGVPDSGIVAAMGYARKSGIPFGTGLVKNRYIGRTFIQPSDEQRRKSVSVKLSPLAAELEGKRVIMIDDSIVRGTTISNLISLIKKHKAKEVHVRISSPKFLYPCFFGTDIPARKELICNKLSTEELCKAIGADSLEFFPIERLDEIIPDCKLDMCNACFSGNYPFEVPLETDKNLFE